MSTLLKRKEYLEKVEKIYPLKDPQKRSFNFNNKNFKEPSFYHYRTGLGISYMYFSSSFKKNISMESKHIANDSSFFIYNNCEAINKIQDRNKKNEYNFKPQHYTLGNITKNFQSYGNYIANKKYCIHYILFDTEIFNNLIKKEHLKDKPLFDIKGFTVNKEISISQKQKLILDDLPRLFCLEGKLQELYLESKIIDLIYVTINDLNIFSFSNEINLSSKDIECLYKAKDILIKNITTPPSLKVLAYKSAINEFKLKKGFKKLFGNTVYGFLQEYRLNEAKKILLNNEININEVSSMVGYKNVSHFSKIFKEYFGVTPIEIKKNQKQVYI